LLRPLVTMARRLRRFTRRLILTLWVLLQLMRTSARCLRRVVGGR